MPSLSVDMDVGVIAVVVVAAAGVVVVAAVVVAAAKEGGNITIIICSVHRRISANPNLHERGEVLRFRDQLLDIPTPDGDSSDAWEECLRMFEWILSGLPGYRSRDLA